MSASSRSVLRDARRVVIKVGTRVLTQVDGTTALSRLGAVVEAVAALGRESREVLLVTSGAVGLGRRALGLDASPNDLALRQACAAVGQSRLMALYQDAFAQLGAVCAQVLLTEEDFHERTRYLNLRRALMALMARRAVPIINENDVVATQELALHESHGKPVFGDNDRLSALVASEIGCDLLVILTDVEGVYDRDPRGNPDARLLSCVSDEDLRRLELAGSSSGVGRGGMRTKVDAAMIAARSGCHAVIASGMAPGALSRVLAGEDAGSWFPARDALSARRRWIAFATRSSGALHLDQGAVKALLTRGASLLAAGVTAVDGEFENGEIVELRGPNGEQLGRGVCEVDSTWMRRWLAGERPDGARLLVVHRNELVLEGSS